MGGNFSIAMGPKGKGVLLDPFLFLCFFRYPDTLLPGTLCTIRLSADWGRLTANRHLLSQPPSIDCH